MADFRAAIGWSPDGVAYNNAYLPVANNYTLNSTTGGWAFSVPITDAITITKVRLRLATKVGTQSPTYLVALRGFDGSGLPGTILGGGSPASGTITPSSGDAGTIVEVTLANSYVASRGEQICCTVTYDSGTLDGSNYTTWTYKWQYVMLNAGWPGVWTCTGGTWAESYQFVPSGAFVGSGGEVMGFVPLSCTQQAFHANSTPDEYAVAFTLPSGMASSVELLGLIWTMRLNASAHNEILTLYDTDGSTVLQQITYTNTMLLTFSNPKVNTIYFDESSLSALTPGSTYRVSYKTDSTSVSVYVHYWTFASAADAAAGAGGPGNIMALSTRSDSGSWTTDSTKVMLASLVLNAMTAASAVGNVDADSYDAVTAADHAQAVIGVLGAAASGSRYTVQSGNW